MVVGIDWNGIGEVIKQAGGAIAGVMTPVIGYLMWRQNQKISAQGQTLEGQGKTLSKVEKNTNHLSTVLQQKEFARGVRLGEDFPGAGPRESAPPPGPSAEP